jgi:hypothetical protein
MTPDERHTMAVLRVRDLHQLARDGITVNVSGWEYPLATFYSETTPAEWVPELPAFEDWQAGQFEIVRAAAQRIADTYNASTPWE